MITSLAPVSACEKGLQWQRALGFLDEMRLVGLQPDVITFNALTSACVKGLQWQRDGAFLERGVTLACSQT